MLSRALENGEIQVIGTSDFSSYRKTFDKDPSLARRFQKIIVEAPSVNETLNILNGIKSEYLFNGFSKIYDCGNVPAEAYESYLRALLIAEFPNTWHRNDRFFGVDIPTDRFCELCDQFAKCL